MALGSKVNDAIDMLFFQERYDRIKIADIGLYEMVVGLVFNVLQIGEITCISKLIEVVNLVIRIGIHEQSYDMRTYESGTAGNENIAFHLIEK